MAPAPEAFDVEVAYARPDRQWVVALQVPPGTTVRQAAQLAGLTQAWPDVDLAAGPLGVWGQSVAGDRPVRPGDRVEIYRPLQCDPRAARRAAAARGGTIGKPR
jgi:putative ubiquitin-RnfH superfamily antitoxin RatB of RatAB toxin-antitoxin module